MQSRHRRISDPRELRVLAHPLRHRIIEMLSNYGAMTATQLADLVDDSPSNCSWHLRNLARAGFVERADAENERDRPWQLTFDSLAFSDLADVNTQRALEPWYQDILDRLVASNLAGTTIMETMFPAWLTEAEAKEIKEEVSKIVDRVFEITRERADARYRPADAQLYQMVSWLYQTEKHDHEETL